MAAAVLDRAVGLLLVVERDRPSEVRRRSVILAVVVLQCHRHQALAPTLSQRLSRRSEVEMSVQEIVRHRNPDSGRMKVPERDHVLARRLENFPVLERPPATVLRKGSRIRREAGTTSS